MSYYMGIVPLWTGIILESGVKHDTTSTVENWFKIVRKKCSLKKTRMTPADFIIEMRGTMKGRLREFEDKKKIKGHTSSKKSKRASRDKSLLVIQQYSLDML